jgi:carboxypeptidase family protein/TonB-dependent receptor-like protein
MKRRVRIEARRLAALGILAAMIAAGAAAQTTSGTLRGTVKDQSGGVLPGVTVEAVNDDTGARLAATTHADGFFNISVAPGPYTVTATLSGFAPATKKTQVLLGQTQGIDFELSLSARTEAVTVSAEAPVIETRSAEVATNVTERQLKQLPQDNRNFLAFAQLAPGVRYNDSPLSKTVTSGALDANAVNVFIDGTSYKNDVLTGGISGQDTSRGNPFPQNAVQEFRVVTQNFKAEYEKSSSAIITAVTKSGGNEFHGDGFAQYQDKSLVADDPCADTVNGRCGTAHKASHEKPDYTRWQAGVSIGGPIVKDKVHFFGSWEYNDQDRANNVAVGSQIGLVPQPLHDQLLAFEGNITSPFQSHLAFGKISWQASSSDIVDTSGFYRKENEIRDFGGQTSFESANNIRNGVWNAQVKNTLVQTTFLSETTVSYNDYRWNPQPVNPGQIGQNYEQVLRIGGGNNHQDFDQRRFTAREDFSYMGLQSLGNHIIKAGAYVNSNSYNVHKFQNDNPEFDYTSSISPDFSFPYQAFFGFGNPDISAHNNQYGVYVQDDWTVNPRLTVNVGLRWDYETDQLNNSYVTPANVVSELSGKVPDGYFTDGTQRPDYTNEFQPRVGLSWDLSGKGTTVLFGGYGRYFDRDTYNYVLDERYRLQYTRLQFLFSADGLPRNGVPTIKWDPKYLSAAGLEALVASGNGPKPQVFLIDNDTKPPVSDQFTAGIRQQLGVVGVSMSYVGSRSRNGYTYIWNNFPCCQHPAPDFAEILLSQASKRGWYDALLVSANKPYTVSSPWGATLAYTWGHATGTGGDLFSLDYVNVAAYPRHRTQFDERHRIVLSGIVGLPWDTRFSTLITLGTGRGYTIVNGDFFGPGLSQVLLYEGTQSGTFPEQSIDLQLSKDFLIGPGRIGFTISVFNVTNHDNLDPGSIDGFIPKNGTNPNFGTAGALLTLPRRLQFGVNVGF